MARHAPNDWQDLRPESLLALEGIDFEEFCASIVRYEATDRHDEPTFDGGAGKYATDHGRDLLVTITKPPETTKRAYQRAHHLTPLTEDPVADQPRTRTAYSCKSGSRWLDLALRDARKRGERVIEVLAEGGYFKLLINQPGKLDAKVKRGDERLTPHEHLRNALWARMKEMDANATDPGPRIQILDVDAITLYLRARQPESGDVVRWLDRLELAPVLKSLEEWRSIHVEDRQEPPFQEDDSRAHLRRELLELIAREPLRPEDRVAYIIGKPGVGKTRLVIETLSGDPATAQRVRVALSPAEADDAIGGHRLLRRHRDVILVIDDCMIDEARSIAARFRVALQEGSRARLVLLVPAAPDAVRVDLPMDHHVWSLDPLDAEHAQAVVAQVIERPPDDEAVVALARFSEGFPWFARLLAIEFKDSGRAPTDMSEAIRWALASVREADSSSAREDLQKKRARSLLAASLTRSIDWDELSMDKRQHLALAVGLQHWEDVMDMALACEKRGLLRRRFGWQFKYVTPQVLERGIITWLLGPDGGPDPGGRTLSHYGEEYLEEFFVTLTRLGLPDKVIAGIADVALHDLQRAPADLSGLRGAGLLGSRLRLLARLRPAETAHQLRQRIDSTDVDELRAKIAERRGLVWTLEALSTHEGSFEDAEASLFRLARAENEALGNNATATWAGLFLVELNATHRSFAARLDLLETRLRETDAAARLVALAGIEATLTMYPTRMAPDGAAGPWPRPSAAEARAGRLRAWSLLAERFNDSERAVAATAKKLALKHLRGAVRFGLGQEVMSLLGSRATDFSSRERVLLLEKLEEIGAYDAEYLDPAGEHLGKLEGAIAPLSFSERLRQRVGVWGPAALRGGDEHLDDVLAQEGLDGSMPLRAELTWLVTDEAQRSHVFAYAIGRCDADCVLFGDIRRLARENPRSWKANALLARYLGGMAKVGRAERADVLLRALQEDPTEATPAALTLVEIGATPEQLRWLERALRDDAIESFAVAELGRRRKWLSAVEDEVFLHFTSALADRNAPEHAAAALGLLIERYEHSVPTPIALEVLERVLAQLAPLQVGGMTEHYWELGTKLLVEHEKASRVAELAVVALSKPHGTNDFAWRALHRAAVREPAGAFVAVARGLDEPGPGGHLLMAFWFHRQPFDWPTADVLAWVGSDERRGRVAAGVIRVQGDSLPRALRELIRRFGPSSSVAREIMCRMQSTDGIVPSLADHDLKQLARARLWLGDPDASVAAFAREIVANLERSHEWHAAYEDDERRRFGT